MLIANVTEQNSQKFNWHAVKWCQVNKIVNNLRGRIFKASANGDNKKASRLQKLMIKSTANKLQAIRRVTLTNQGKATPGIDQVTVKTSQERELLFDKLKKYTIQEVSPVKRVYIPKKSGKRRPLGLPTIIDRCKQAIIKSALEPYWEARFERISYGFRPGRSAHDAIQKIYCIARAGKSRKWILDADIKGAFDNIDHDYLLKVIGNFPGKAWIKKWLTAGVMEANQLSSTMTGTPQGGVISPLLANIALHGMEEALKVKYDKLGRITPKTKFVIVRYADDFVVMARSKELCEEAKVVLTPWLAERGLQFSEEKTSIRGINEGFNFLGFNIRHYQVKNKKKGYVLLIKPSKESIKSFIQGMRAAWKKILSLPLHSAIEYLNPKISGWCDYYKAVASSKTFNQLGHWLWERQSIYAYRKHPNKHWWWKIKKYWGKLPWRNDKWVFMDKNTKKYLWNPSWTKIERHKLVKGTFSPDDPSLKEYWNNRAKHKCKHQERKRRDCWYRQQGKCTHCNDYLDNGEKLHLHHIIPKLQGGSDNMNNLCLVHYNCHKQIHRNLKICKSMQTA